MSQHPLPQDVRNALARGEKMRALQLLVAAGIGLAQAKALVAGRGRPAAAHTPAQATPAAPAPGHAHDDVMHALAAGNRIRAIQLYRRHAGVDLREAKEAVERLALQSGRDPSGLAPGEVPRSGAGSWVLPGVAVALGFALYFWLR